MVAAAVVAVAAADQGTAFAAEAVAGPERTTADRRTAAEGRPVRTSAVLAADPAADPEAARLGLAADLVAAGPGTTDAAAVAVHPGSRPDAAVH